MRLTQNKKIPAWLIDKISGVAGIEHNEIEYAEYIPQRFADSTHDLWRLVSKQGNYFLKVCRNTDSPFWQIMQQLFALDLKQDIQGFDNLYAHISMLTSLQTPALIKAESIAPQGAYILTKEVLGVVPDSVDISQKMVEQLAQHLSHLHKDKHQTWGSMTIPQFDKNDWSARLKEALIKSARKWGGDKQAHKKYLQKALHACELMEALMEDANTEAQFVPMMPDLRWDQFILSKHQAMVLVDLDAFVLAPRELDFVLLEFLLDKQQMDWFIGVYANTHTIPELDIIRPAYRLLLFYMQILGEQDIENWMTH